MFPDDEACLCNVEELRWPDGFSCPACGARGKPWRATRGRLVCRVCRRQTRVTAGTIFDKTRTPLTTWFEAAWHVTTAKSGMSAVVRKHHILGVVALRPYPSICIGEHPYGPIQTIRLKHFGQLLSLDSKQGHIHLDSPGSMVSIRNGFLYHTRLLAVANRIDFRHFPFYTSKELSIRLNKY
jgi:hypothetical protein